MMIRIIIYLFVLLIGDVVLALIIYYNIIDLKSKLIFLGTYCALFGLLGGIVNCLRSIYIHFAAKKDWDEKYAVWYYLRPIVSSIMGVVSYIFIKAGLLVFTAQTAVYSNTSTMAYLSFAFLAGYNVHNFLKKIEEVSKAILGIEP